ncbi:ATPase, F1 complex, gamma subunit conserved site domain-containing protein [Rozella allomycis CSF55]|uniref:ATP synthase subunit gamma n=1 Tax=Rozella allomycis (strain CSF55) TaxID=988480 RepID=A0A075AZ41_ROZAC|nr:ATPase, F1 complex, gamma subunit conserved site domain-containing protein [Rozella allomycis CSF55]|eukprot:EPZ35399.1 ATPase, F1 complex, gamma subunit conserved site domain-containing protein [Rozella allomycis CSF55]
MKMIASTKLSRAQKAMEKGRVFGTSCTRFGSFIDSKQIKDSNNQVLVVVSSDRGLCGAIHSSVSKMAKKQIKIHPSTKIIVLGDKAKAQISRDARKNILASFNQIGKTIPTFTDALLVTQLIFKTNSSYDKLGIIYNRFKSVIAYDTLTLPVFTSADLANSAKISDYEIDDPESVIDYTQFLTASSIYWAMIETHASEMSARRTAMENATKNAGEIIDNLTMKFNRTRQSVITNELVDIITGASAL